MVALFHILGFLFNLNRSELREVMMNASEATLAKGSAVLVAGQYRREHQRPQMLLQMAAPG